MIDPRTALEAIGQLPDSEIDLADAAIQLARAGDPDADWEGARAHLSELARSAVALAATLAETDIGGRATGLRHLLVTTHGYEGDALTYDDLANTNLIHVIERRQGLPVALGILWLHCAHAAGWSAHGIDFPSHFLIALAGRKAQIVMDPFSGGTSLDSDDLKTLFRKIAGPDAKPPQGILRPMPRRAILLRLQNNIRARHLHAGHLRHALATTETMLAIAPDNTTLQEEAAELRARLN
jgi:regulator of sirC expression with transglutaminase-like and TPR domain